MSDVTTFSPEFPMPDDLWLVQWNARLQTEAVAKARDAAAEQYRLRAAHHDLGSLDLMVRVMPKEAAQARWYAMALRDYARAEEQCPPTS